MAMKASKKTAKKAARKKAPAYASQRAFQKLRRDCQTQFSLHWQEIRDIDSKRLQQYRQHEARLSDYDARMDDHKELLQDALRATSESTIRALCKSEIMAHMQRLLGAERWKEMMAAPGVVVHATAETILTPLKPEPMSTASLLIAAAVKIADLQSTVTAEYGEDDQALESVRLERQLRDRAENIKHGEPEV